MSKWPVADMNDIMCCEYWVSETGQAMDEKPASNEIYDQVAERYAELVKTKPHNAFLERPAIRALVPDIRGGRVLDAGCGSGVNLQWLIDQGAHEVVGIDVSAKMIEIAAREAIPNVSLFIADMSHPLDLLETDSFDLVLSSLVVHYIEDQQAFFAEMARLLRPGGRFVFSTHHPQSDFSWHPGNYFETVYVTDEWRGFADEAIKVSFYRRPLSAITEALTDAGFIIERLTEPQPTQDYLKADPAGYEKARQQPAFLCIRAHLR